MMTRIVYWETISNIFLQQPILALFLFGVFYFDYGELSSESMSLHSLIRNLIL